MAHPRGMSFFRTVLPPLLVAAGLLVPCAASAQEYSSLDENGDLQGGFVQLEGHLSALSDATDRALLAGTFGVGARAGWRWSDWGAFLQIEHNMWLSTELTQEVVQGAVNIGIGGEYTFAEGFCRTSLSLGPSILAFDTVLDDAGAIGFFLDARVLGLRWTPHERIVLGLDPIAFAIVAPVLDGIPLVNVEYKTVFYVETPF